MDDLIRIIVTDERIKNMDNNKFKLTSKESHYLNKVMRMKNDKEVFIVNGLGSIWKGNKVNDNFIELNKDQEPFFFREKKKLLLGLAISIPKQGFEEILKMSTEIGIDFIQPISTDYQIKNLSKSSNTKRERWNSIINESLELSERLWKPYILKNLEISEWLESISNKDIISISVTRNTHCQNIDNWLEQQEISEDKETIIWNVIGPEGGWSQSELQLFQRNNIEKVKLSENILRTSTAAIYASSILNQWRNNQKNL